MVETASSFGSILLATFSAASSERRAISPISKESIFCRRFNFSCSNFSSFKDAGFTEPPIGQSDSARHFRSSISTSAIRLLLRPEAQQRRIWAFYQHRNRDLSTSSQRRVV